MIIYQSLFFNLITISSWDFIPNPDFIFYLDIKNGSKKHQGCFLNNFLIYLKLKCGQAIFERSSQLPSLTKALYKTKAI